jgi:hypothetical protein
MSKRRARTMFLDPDFRREPKTERYCCRCQKDLGAAAVRVYLRGDGATVVHPSDVEDYREAGDIGWWWIGLDCARALPRGWTAV